MNRKIYHKLAACLCVALLLPACAGKGQPASGVAPAQPQSMQDASATTKPAAEGERGYVFPPYTGVGQAPAYAKPVELPGPELIPLDCMLEELDPDKRAEGELFGRSIRYIPFDGIEYVEIPSPIITKNWEGGGAFVAGQNFAAAVWGVDSLNAAVSRDNGESWESMPSNL